MRTKLTYQEEMKLARRVLSKLSVFDPYAIVAGGAPRDWYFEKECNDIDVWLNDVPRWLMGDYSTMLETLFQTDVKFLGKEYENFPEAGQRLRYVFSLMYGGKEFQFMVVANTHHCVEQFSCNMSKIWTKGRGLRHTYEFLSGVEDKKLHFQNCKQEYKDKVIKMFPEYLVLAEDADAAAGFPQYLQEFTNAD